ncbi:MAG: hypothetical protein ACRENJ_03940 [Candidatus Eiseniibacteriota bacterium]
MTPTAVTILLTAALAAAPPAAAARGHLPSDDGSLVLSPISGPVRIPFDLRDYRRRRMTLEPNGRLGEPFEADMCGIAPRMGPEDSYTIDRVRRASAPDGACAVPGRGARWAPTP